VRAHSQVLFKSSKKEMIIKDKLIKEMGQLTEPQLQDYYREVIKKMTKNR